MNSHTAAEMAATSGTSGTGVPRCSGAVTATAGESTGTMRLAEGRETEDMCNRAGLDLQVERSLRHNRAGLEAMETKAHFMESEATGRAEWTESAAGDDGR